MGWSRGAGAPRRFREEAPWPPERPPPPSRARGPCAPRAVPGCGAGAGNRRARCAC
ncbi:hypothetical protein EBESD8_7650 [Rhodococcus aetherivorans]|nr:hypothetical protein EBESD8_7650 [Rhodococcus aetherivorans]